MPRELRSEVICSSFEFLKLGTDFTWQVLPLSITAQGYYEGKYCTLKLEYVQPPQKFTFDRQGCDVSMEAPSSPCALFSGLEVTVHYPPTVYRAGTLETRHFAFNHYIASPYNCNALYLMRTPKGYQWMMRINYLTVEVNEEALARDLHLWLLAMCS